MHIWGRRCILSEIIHVITSGFRAIALSEKRLLSHVTCRPSKGSLKNEIRRITSIMLVQEQGTRNYAGPVLV